VGAVIDSSVLIAAERGKLDLERVLRDYGDEPIAIAAITASELLHGVHRAAESSQRNRREAFVERLLAELPLIPFDLLVARVHSRLSAELAAKGSPVGAHDLLIAATALAVGYDVATRDER
jgi:tRNA(fMet)-specific endonuclease VapC